MKRCFAASVAFMLGASFLLPASAATLTAQDFSSTAQYARVLRSFNPSLSHSQSRALADHVRTEALFYRLDARLLVALVATESSWHPYVTSPVGAGGLGQLMPGTAAGLGVNAYQPFANLNGTARYLRGLLDRFRGYDQPTRYAFALAGYNAGPGAVEKYGGVPPYTETQNYVRNVMGIWHHLSLSLSSHIDDYMGSASYKAHPRKALALTARVRVHHSVTAARAYKGIAVNRLPEAPLPLSVKKKPFLYYFFHRGHKDAPAVAEAANGMGPDPASIDAPAKAPNPAGLTLAIQVPPSVGGNRPIRVVFPAPLKKPVTLVACIGSTVVAQTIVPAHARSATLKGVASADAIRILVVHAYAQGYNAAHAAVTITPKGATVAAR